jgi:hypothetical protein
MNRLKNKFSDNFGWYVKKMKFTLFFTVKIQKIFFGYTEVGVGLKYFSEYLDDMHLIYIESCFYFSVVFVKNKNKTLHFFFC